MKKQDFVELALSLGATDAVAFSIDDIVFDSRTLLKCMFGCPDWGYGNTCPSRPGSPKPWEYEKMFKEFKWGIIIHCTDKKKAQDISYEVERLAFLDGYYFAFSMSDCAICEKCAGFADKPCISVKKARPAFHSVGIDVFATVGKFGLPIDTLKTESETTNWYSAVWIK